MAPKTCLNDNENNIKINQLNNTELNQNSTVDQIKLDDALKYELNFEIKDQLIMILNEFTSLLFNDKNKENVIKKSNNLLHNLIDLPLKMEHTEENEINSTNDLFKSTLVINHKMKSQIIDLLTINNNYSILLKNSNKNAKLDLIKENNNLVIKLMQFPFQMLKIDDKISNDFVWKRLPVNDSNHTVLTDNQLVAKSKSSKEIIELEEKICILTHNLLVAKSKSDKEIIELKEKISILNDDYLFTKSESNKEIDNLKNELIQLKNVIHNPNKLFIKRKDNATCSIEFRYDQLLNCFNETTTLPFECLDLNWMIKVQNLEDYYYFELILMNKLDSMKKIIKKIKANCELILLNKNDPSNTSNMSLNFDLILDQDRILKSYGKISRTYLILYYLTGDNNKLSTIVNLTAESVCKEV